jgi:hypothetical protein
MVTVCTTECHIKFATNSDYLPENNPLNHILVYLDCVPATHELKFYEQYTRTQTLSHAVSRRVSCRGNSCSILGRSVLDLQRKK